MPIDSAQCTPLGSAEQIDRFAVPADSVVDVTKHIGLAHSIASKYRWACGRRLDFDDLLQSGCVGLLEAARRFEPGRGFQFSTYATYWIRNCVQRQVETIVFENRSPGQRPPRSAHGKHFVSIFDKIGDSERDNIGSFISANYGRSYRETMRDLRQCLADLTHGLKPREMTIAHMRYGGDATYAELAFAFHLTRQRIDQILRNIVEPHMRKRAEACGYDDFVTWLPSEGDGWRLEP